MYKLLRTLACSAILCACWPLNAQIQWLLPLSETRVPVGQPAPGSFLYREAGRLVLQTLDAPPQMLPYDSASWLNGSYWEVWRQQKKGIYHDQRGELLPPVYQSVAPVDAKRDNWAFVVQKYGMIAVLDWNNRPLLSWSPNGYQGLRYTNDTILEHLTQADRRYFNQAGKQVPWKQVDLQGAPQFKRLALKTYTYKYLKNGKMQQDTFSAVEPFANGVAAVCRDTLWGYLTEAGTWLISPRFQQAKSFDELGFAVVKARGKYGLIRRDGKFSAQPAFSFVKPFLPGLFEVRDGERVGVIDTLGKVLLEPGQYQGLQQAGSGAFAAKTSRELVFYSNLGERLPLEGVTECKHVNGQASFVVTSKNPQTGHYVNGLANAEGRLLLPLVLTNVQLYRHFVLVGTHTEAGDSWGAQLPRSGRYWLFNPNNGQLILQQGIDGAERLDHSPLAVIRIGPYQGLVSATEGLLLETDYDAIQLLNHGWCYVRRGNAWGVVKVK